MLMHTGERKRSCFTSWFLKIGGLEYSNYYPGNGMTCPHIMVFILNGENHKAIAFHFYIFLLNWDQMYSRKPTKSGLQTKFQGPSPHRKSKSSQKKFQPDYQINIVAIKVCNTLFASSLISWTLKELQGRVHQPGNIIHLPINFPWNSRIGAFAALHILRWLPKLSHLLILQIFSQICNLLVPQSLTWKAAGFSL